LDLKAIIKLLGKEHGSADAMTGAFLDDAVASFTAKPAAATKAIRQLQAGDPSGFALAAVRLLAAQTGKSPGAQYVAGLLFAGNLLMDPLLDEDALPLGVAIALARNLATAEPVLDASLLRKLLTKAGGDVRTIKTSSALRALRLVEAISDCSRLSSYLVQLLRHPSSEVQSKVALLLGRANLNLTRVKTFLGSGDARLRANTVESLWGHQSAAVQEVLREAANDSSGRASMNALLELCRQGDREAFERIGQAAASADAIQRSRAAWAMGQSGDPEFAALLAKLAADGDANVREMAHKGQAQLRPPKPEPDKPEPKEPKSPVTEEPAAGFDEQARGTDRSAA
jgi:hypothetical protein